MCGLLVVTPSGNTVFSNSLRKSRSAVLVFPSCVYKQHSWLKFLLNIHGNIDIKRSFQTTLAKEGDHFI
jgi:hypothetical protein